MRPFRIQRHVVFDHLFDFVLGEDAAFDVVAVRGVLQDIVLVHLCCSWVTPP